MDSQHKGVLHRQATKQKLSGLALSFLQADIVSAKTIELLPEFASQTNLITYLVENKLAKSKHIAKFIAQKFASPFFDLDELDLQNLPLSLIDKKLIKQYQVLPIASDGQRVTLAMIDTSWLEAINTIAFSTQLKVDTVVVEADKLAKIINQLYAQSATCEYFDNLDNIDKDIQSNEGVADKTLLDTAVDEAPVVRFVQKMLTDAIQMRASDLHFEPYETHYRVRFRIDGILQTIATPPVQMASKITTRLKVMAQLDISERRIPQDGRIKLSVESHLSSEVNDNTKQTNKQSIDFRVSSLPTLFGEKIVLRILDTSTKILEIDKLGLAPLQQSLYLQALAKPQGMIIITGPTGSGKTVSLYTGLNILNTDERNIATAEDPVEINLAGVNQVNINPKVGLSFASALRSFLRQDPDVVMVGEIRDLETAETAIMAAQTGHLVLSTLHTNSALETITRLKNMGVASFNIATSVSLIIAQRLARRLCEHCKAPANIPPASLLEMGFTPVDISEGQTIFQAVGCEHCREGYKGRVGIYEVLAIDEKIAQAIMAGSLTKVDATDNSTMRLQNLVEQQGMQDLRQSAIKKVLQGVTSIQEMYRVISE
ncbi:type IV-A pilus assembly ATPase PilB [Psychrobacter sp. HD31]|uniref:type IV-A pilus assembly ATPase PilB n=1 Tax=Psychrobacter sp. HD31 TaxID=3112003 RepID=UPI003DA4EA04